MTLTAPRTIAGQVAERLKAEILAGERPAGARLRQVEIAQQLRRQHDAGARGAGDAAARRASSSTTRSAARSCSCRRVDDLRHHYEIRAALEALAAAKAAERFEPAWAPPLEALLRRDARRRRPRRATSRSTSASTRRSTSTPARTAAGGDDRRAARRVERLPAHLPRRRADFPVARLDAEHRAILAACVARDPAARRRGHPRAPREHRRARRVQAMKRSTERILTTHVGSLPRPDDLIRTMFAKQEGVPVDAVALERAHPLRRRRDRRQAGRRRRRRRQRRRDEQAELRRPTSRTASTASAATSQPLTYADLVDFPVLQRQGLRRPRPLAAPTPACDAPITVARPRGRRGPTSSTSRRRCPTAEAGVPERRLAGRDRALLPQRPLRHPRGVPLRDRRRDAGRVRGGDRRRAPRCRSTARTSAMGRHIQFADDDLDGVPHGGAS